MLVFSRSSEGSSSKGKTKGEKLVQIHFKQTLPEETGSKALQPASVETV